MHTRRLTESKERLTCGKKNIEKYDIVISNPPFSMKVPAFTASLTGKTSTDGNIFFIDYCIRHLKEDGRGGVIMMTSILCKDGDTEDARNALIEQKRLAVAMNFTTNLFESTNIGTCMLCIGAAERPLLIDCTDKTVLVKKWTYSEGQIKEILNIFHERKTGNIRTFDEVTPDEYLVLIPDAEGLKACAYAIDAKRHLRGGCVTEQDLKETVWEYMKWKFMQAFQIKRYE